MSLQFGYDGPTHTGSVTYGKNTFNTTLPRWSTPMVKVKGKKSTKKGTVVRHNTSSTGPGQYAGKLGTIKTRKEDPLRSKALNKGMLFHQEAATSYSTDDALTMVHALAPLAMSYCAWGALIRALSEDASDIKVTDLNDVVATSLFPTASLTTKILFSYYANNVTTVETPGEISIGADTWLSVGETVSNYYSGLYLANKDLLVKTLSLEIDGDVILTWNAQNIKLECFQKSTAFIQNTTESLLPDGVTLTQLTSTNSNPVEVQKYTGKGNGPHSRYNRTIGYNFIGNKESGFAVNNVYGEIFDSKQFDNCKKDKKDYLSPGVIKNSYVSDRHKGFFFTFVNKLAGNEATDHTMVKWGYYNMYFFENIINKSNLNLKIDIEGNNVVYAVVQHFAKSTVKELSATGFSFPIIGE